MSVPVLYTVNELNVFRLALAALFRRPVHVLSVEPYFPPLRALLGRWVKVLVARGGAVAAGVTFADLTVYDDEPYELQVADIYPRCEAALASYYRFDEADRRLDDYALIYKHAVMTHLKWQMKRVGLLHKAAPALADRSALLVGTPREILDIYRIAFGQPPFTLACRPTFVERTATLVIALAVLTVTLGFIASRIRFGRVAHPFHAMGADLGFEGKARDIFLSITREPSEILFVCRNRQVLGEVEARHRRTYTHVTPLDGAFTPGEAFKMVGTAGADVVALWRHFRTGAAGLFFNIVKQPLKRAMFRALFARYPVGAFLARDEYNTDAITRTQELRRAGMRSVGIMHGLPAVPSIYPQFRYVDFDVLYVFGKHHHDVYRDTWPAGMRVTPLGTFRMSEESRKLRPDPAARDIVLFVNQIVDNDALIDAYKGIAAAFPDRRIYIKLKYSKASPRNRKFCEDYERRLAGISERAILTEENPYDLMLRAGYCFGGPTTATVEFLQLGGIGFCVDTFDPDHDVFFRHFPEFCVSGADEAIARIRAIEAGEWVYPREKFADLVDFTKKDVRRVLRRDLGLDAVQDSAAAA
jgi:hypothetical protein